MTDRDDSDLEKALASIQAEIEMQEAEDFSETVLSEARDPSNVGRLEDPDGSARIKGSCGDTMWMDVSLEGDVVRDVRFFTDGCGASTACGSMATRLAKGKTVDEVLAITDDVMFEKLGKLPEENHHCVRLAVATLHRAVREAVGRNG